MELNAGVAVLKTIMYVSKSTESLDANGLPGSMAPILVSSRKKNRTHDLRAAVIFHRGFYMQAVEGDDVPIDLLLNSLKNDLRHENLRVLVNTTINQSYLENQPFKLISVYEECDDFVRYVNANLLKNYALKTNVGVIFKALRDEQLRISGSVPNNRFSRYTLSLLNWPTFDVVEPTRELLELCAVLTTNEISYSSLCAINPYSNESDLDSTLGKLQGMGLIKLTEVEEGSSHSSFMAGSFFKKVRTFIGRGST